MCRRVHSSNDFDFYLRKNRLFYILLPSSRIHGRDNPKLRKIIKGPIFQLVISQVLIHLFEVCELFLKDTFVVNILAKYECDIIHIDVLVIHSL